MLSIAMYLAPLTTVLAVLQAVSAVFRARFAPQAIGSATLAVSAMETTDEINRLLVQRGLLPPFTLP
jgi:hypothetical protein